MDVAPPCQRLHEINMNLMLVAQKMSKILIFNSITLCG